MLVECPMEFFACVTLLPAFTIPMPIACPITLSKHFVTGVVARHWKTT